MNQAIVMRPSSFEVHAVRALATSRVRFGGDYDWNLGVPGSRIKNPDPKAYNDVYPGMGPGWWTMIVLAFCSFFWSQWFMIEELVEWLRSGAATAKKHAKSNP